MQTNTIIDLPTAILGFMQVGFTSVGLYFIIRIIFSKNKLCGNLALLGSTFILLGYTFKACWQLIQAVSGEDKPSLNNSLYIFLSAGFICLAFSLYRSQRRVEAMKLSHIWTIPLFLVGIAWAVSGYVGFFTNNRAWFFILLWVGTFANVLLLLQLIYRSLKPQPNWLSAGLFILNLIIIFMFIKNNNQDVSSQIKIMFGQAGFAAASWLLLKKER
jgi:hypothetical protein